MAVRETITWRDARGFTCKTTYFVGGASVGAEATAAQAVATAAAGISNCHLQQANGPYVFTPTEAVYGTAADYADVEDKAQFTFQDSVGNFHRFTVPAPLAAIFLSDGKTVDPSNTGVVAYTSAVIANCLNRNGSAIGFGGNGTRKRVRTQRKMNAITLNPALTGPGL